MKLTVYQVDAFAEKLFTGNPAGVVPLEKWIDDSLMQQIAMENNLAETAFFVPRKKEFDIRWFTPVKEINLCGHATLASGYVLFREMDYDRKKIVFNSQSGPLVVSRKKELIEMDFPSWMPEKWEEYPEGLRRSLGNPEVVGVYRNRDIVVELQNEDEVRNLKPDFSLLKKLPGMVMVTAPGKDVDFVSRFFAPTAGIDEDPVTGSAHSQLIPFWSYKLNKTKMLAKQLSQRGGTIHCEQKGERVIMGGKCVPYLKGKINVEC